MEKLNFKKLNFKKLNLKKFNLLNLIRFNLMRFNLIILGLVVLVVSCGVEEKKVSPELKGLMVKIEKGEASLSEIERAMFLNVSEEGGNPKWVVEVYEKNKDSFVTNAMARIYYATALCQLAGSAKKEEEQVFWVRKGIMEFEMIIEDFPNEHRAVLWRAITYSHFPPVLGATNYVIDDVEHINELRAKGVKFAPEEIALLTKSYLNIAKIYKSPEFLNMAKKQFDKDKPYLKESIITELSNQIAKVEEEIK